MFSGRVRKPSGTRGPARKSPSEQIKRREEALTVHLFQIPGLRLLRWLALWAAA